MLKRTQIIKIMAATLAPLAIAAPLIGCKQSSEDYAREYYERMSAIMNYNPRSGFIDGSIDRFFSLSFPQSALVSSDFEENNSNAFELSILISEMDQESEDNLLAFGQSELL